jgi:hypothetical protein
MEGTDILTLDLSVKLNGKETKDYLLDPRGISTIEEFLEFIRTAVINIASEEWDKEKAKGYLLDPVIIVDKKAGKPIEQVKPFGRIEIRDKDNLGDILTDAMKFIISRSPVDTGLYVSSHRVVVNGAQVASDMASLKAWLDSGPSIPQGSVIRIINIQPYARKLERYGIINSNVKRDRRRYGKAADRRVSQKILVPNGVYHLAYRSIKRKFSANLNVYLDFISGSKLGFLGAGLSQGRFKTETFRSGGQYKTRSYRKKKPASTYLYPAITFKIGKGTGLANG